MKDYLLFEKGIFRLSLAWYDVWLGFFIDTNKGRLYICLLPMVLLTIKIGSKLINEESGSEVDVCGICGSNEIIKLRDRYICANCKAHKMKQT